MNLSQDVGMDNGKLSAYPFLIAEMPISCGFDQTCIADTNDSKDY